MGYRFYCVRLYAIHDPDLMSLYFKGYKIGSAIRDAVLALSYGEIYRYQIYVPKENVLINKKSVQIKLVFHEEKDKKVIELIEKVPSKMRNFFFKNVFRLYLVRPYESALLSDPQCIQDLDQVFAIFPGETEILKCKRENRGKTRRRKEKKEAVLPDIIERMPEKTLSSSEEEDLTDFFSSLL